MLSDVSKNVTYSAASIIEDESGIKTTVMFMSAVVNSSGDVNITQTIKDKELYLLNKDAVDRDYETFRLSVMEG